MKAYAKILTCCIATISARLPAPDPQLEFSPVPQRMSMLGYYIEQYYLSSDPDFSILPFTPGRTPLDMLSTADEELTQNFGGISELLPRHPNLPIRLAKGAQYRKEVYDQLLMTLPDHLSKAGQPLFLGDHVLKSYADEIQAWRREEARRSLVEAQALAYEKLRVDLGYAPGTSVSSWAREHESRYQALTEHLREERVREKTKDEFLPPERYEKWLIKERDLVSQFRVDEFRRALDSKEYRGHHLPKPFVSTLEHARSRDKKDLGVELSDPLQRRKFARENQRDLLRVMTDFAAGERGNFDAFVRTLLGTGTYDNPSNDSDALKAARWLRDLEWYEFTVPNPEQWQLKNARALALRRYREGWAEFIPTWAQLSSAVPSSDSGVLTAENYARGEGRLVEVPFFRGSAYGDRESALPESAPLEYHWGGVDDWNEAKAFPHAGFAGRGSFTYRSAGALFPRRGLVSIFRPEGFNARVTLIQDGEYLTDGRGMNLFETPEGYLFAKLDRPSSHLVKTIVHYAKNRWARLKFGRNEKVFPPLTGREMSLVGEVARELGAMGEKRLSAELVRLVAEHHTGQPILPSDISSAIAASSLYSYFPAKLDPNHEGRAEAFAPFLNKQGVLCIQCTGASGLLKHILDKILVDHRDWTVRLHTTLVREEGGSDIGTDGLHRVLSLTKGNTRLMYDATPLVRDGRARAPTQLASTDLWRTSYRSASNPPEPAAIRGRKDYTKPKDSSAAEGEGVETGERAAEGEGGGVGPAHKSSRLIASMSEMMEWAKSVGQSWGSQLAIGVHALVPKKKPKKDKELEVAVSPHREPSKPTEAELKEARVSTEILVEVKNISPAAKAAILAELRKRRARNEDRQLALKAAQDQVDLMMLQLAGRFQKPVRNNLGLPHQIVLELMKDVTALVQGRSGDAERLKKRLEEARQTIEQEQRYFLDPNHPLPWDPVRQKFLDAIALSAAKSVVDRLDKTEWTPYESEALEDIEAHLKSGTDDTCQKKFGKLSGY